MRLGDRELDIIDAEIARVAAETPVGHGAVVLLALGEAMAMATELRSLRASSTLTTNDAAILASIVASIRIHYARYGTVRTADALDLCDRVDKLLAAATEGRNG